MQRSVLTHVPSASDSAQHSNDDENPYAGNDTLPLLLLLPSGELVFGNFAWCFLSPLFGQVQLLQIEKEMIN